MNTPKNLLLSAGIALGTVQCTENELIPEEISSISIDTSSDTEQILLDQSLFFDAQMQRADLADKVPDYMEGFPEAGGLTKESLQIARRSFQKFVESKQAEAKKILTEKSKTDGFNADWELGEFVKTVENPIYCYNLNGNSVSVQFFATNDSKEFRDYLFDRIVIGDIGFKIPLKSGNNGQSLLMEKKVSITVKSENSYAFDVYSFKYEDGSNGSSLSVGFGLGDEKAKTMETLNHMLDVVSYTNQFDENSYTNSHSSDFEIPEHLKPVDRLF